MNAALSEPPHSPHTTRKPAAWLLVAIALPLVMYAALVVRAEYKRHGSIVRLHITGRDPRDLLRGQYLNYRVVWSDQGMCSPLNGDDCCVVFAGDLPLQSGSQEVLCRNVPPGSLYASVRALQELNMFYIEENSGPALEAAIRRDGASVEVVLTHAGGASVRELFIDGVPHRQWLATNAEASH